MKSILLVDDSSATRSIIASALQDLGDLRIVEASSGFEALRVLPTEAFDLVLTDINMPDINGLEVVAFMSRNERYRHIPIVIVSSESAARDRDRALELGARQYVTKPFDPRTLRAVLCPLLGLSEAN
ncbi:MAG: response regulator [Candidatus Schekmanbacteria bacterium]|nr:response regulator [Candidatus Schekmanbacteria bacterium]